MLSWWESLSVELQAAIVGAIIAGAFVLIPLLFALVRYIVRAEVGGTISPILELSTRTSEILDRARDTAHQIERDRVALAGQIAEGEESLARARSELEQEAEWILEELRSRRDEATADAQQVETALKRLNKLDYRRGIGLAEYVSLDVDNDGQHELLIFASVTKQPMKVYDFTSDGVVEVEVEQTNDELPIVEDLTLADIDQDGQNEIVIVLGWSANTGLLFLRYRNARYELLRYTSDSESDPIFPDARIEDIDGDGRLEVVSDPWDSIAPEFWPDDLDLKRDDPDVIWPTGRIRTIFRWDSESDRFEPTGPPQLLSLGGR